MLFHRVLLRKLAKENAYMQWNLLYVQEHYFVNFFYDWNSDRDPIFRKYFFYLI